MHLLWLPDVLRAAGRKVVEMDGWKSSGVQRGTVKGIVAHHTATKPGTSDEAVERLLRNGRPDLKGPLCQLGLRRDGTWVVIAAGRANHNGYGEWGNDSIGVEAYNDGVGEPWPRAQYDSFAAGCAALAAHCGVPVKGHKETDPARKIDPTFDMDQFRADMNQEDDMSFTEADRALLGEVRAIAEHNRWNRDALDSISAAIGKIAAGDGASATEILDELAKRLGD